MNVFIHRASTISDLPPKIRAQFFYTSALPIDDPLSPLPAFSTSSSSTSSKLPPRPFSVRDNAELEQAWQELQRSGQNESPEKNLGEQMWAKGPEMECKHAKASTHIHKGTRSGQSVTKSGNLNHIVRGLSKERAKSQPSRRASAGASNPKEGEKSKLSAFETASQLSLGTSGTEDESGTEEATHILLCDERDHAGLDMAKPIQPEELATARAKSGPSRGETKSHRSPVHRGDKTEKVEDQDDITFGEEASLPRPNSRETPYGSSPSDKMTTGTPFLRVPSRDRGPISSAPNSTVSQIDGATAIIEDVRRGRLLTRSMLHTFRSSSHDTEEGHLASSNSPGPSFLSQRKETEPLKAYIPVGISRLHLVELPDLVVCKSLIAYYLEKH